MRYSITSALLAATLLLTATQARAVTAVSNMNNPDATSYTSLLEAVSFTTGDEPAVLSSISARYFCTSSTFGMNMFASLRADAGGSPGTILEVFPDQTGPAGHGVVTFPSAGTSLAPHTTYWFHLDTRTATFWETTSLLTESSAFGWTIGDQFYYVPGPAAGRFSVDATILPEPATLALAALPIGYVLSRRRSNSGVCR